MKVIVAGLSKTGTKTMAAALKDLGYDVYDYLENYMYLGNDWERICRDGGTSEDFRRMYENVDAIVDIPACAFWDEIHAAFPDAKIILTMRESEDVWYKSQLSQVKASSSSFVRILSVLSPTHRRMHTYNQRMVTAVYSWNSPKISLFGEYPMNETLMRMAYRRHNAHVLLNAPKDKLLVYCVKDGWDPLCKFLDLPVPTTPFPHKNVRGNIVEELLKHNPVFIRMQREALINGTLILSLLVYGGYKWSRGSSPLSWLRHVGSCMKSLISNLPV